MKLPIVKDTLLNCLISFKSQYPERISDCVMNHVLARTRPGAEKIGGHTFIVAGTGVIIVSYDNNGLVDYISSHSTKPQIEDVRK